MLPRRRVAFRPVLRPLLRQRVPLMRTSQSARSSDELLAGREGVHIGRRRTAQSLNSAAVDPRDDCTAPAVGNRAPIRAPTVGPSGAASDMDSGYRYHEGRDSQRPAIVSSFGWSRLLWIATGLARAAGGARGRGGRPQL